MAKIRYVLKGDLGFVESFDYLKESLFYTKDVKSALFFTKKSADRILSSRKYSSLTKIPVKVDEGVISLADKSDIKLFSHGSRISRLEKEVSELRRLLSDLNWLLDFLVQREINYPTSRNP
jgi:uncharacterized protein HemX